MGTSEGESWSARNRRDDRRTVPGLCAFSPMGNRKESSGSRNLPAPTGSTGVYPEGQRGPTASGIDETSARSPHPAGNLRLSVSGRSRPSARRRLRMCYWKQWKRCRKRVGQLLKLGVSERQAVLTALSRKSYWHLSRTMATQWGLNDAWLKSQPSRGRDGPPLGGSDRRETSTLGLGPRTMDRVSLPGFKSVRVACPVTG